MRLPSGLNATLVHRVRVAGERLADGLAGVGVPQPHRLVATAGDDAVPVGAERHAEHRVRVAGERLADGLAGVGIPQPHGLVVAAGGDARAVGAERHAGHPSVWPVSGWPMGWPVSASHSRTVLSRLPEAIRLPSGLNATPELFDVASAILSVLIVFTSAVSSGPSSGVCASRRPTSSCSKARTSPPERLPASIDCASETSRKLVASRKRASACFRAC